MISVNEIKLCDIPTEMEDEVTRAKAISELMRMCYTTACGYNVTNTNIYDIENALWLIWNMLDEHANKLNELKDGTYDIYYKYKNIKGTVV